MGEKNMKYVFLIFAFISSFILILHWLDVIILNTLGMICFIIVLIGSAYYYLKIVGYFDHE